MLTKNLCFVLFSLLLSGCQFIEPGIRGSGTMKREVREVGPFDRVNISGSANVEILSGQPAGTCEVECDDNLLEHLTTTVEDGELKIYFAEKVSTSKSLQIWLSTEHLSKISVSGSATGKVQGIDEPSTEIDISGRAKLQCVGKTGNLKMNVSGSADFECLELAADDVVISIAGSGNAKVQAIRTSKVSISGSGSIKYLGAPEIEKSIVGSGSVKPVEQ